MTCLGPNNHDFMGTHRCQCGEWVIDDAGVVRAKSISVGPERGNQQQKCLSGEHEADIHVIAELSNSMWLYHACKHCKCVYRKSNDGVVDYSRV